ncbi:hypothetical protein ACE7GA_23035 [Roseomonas sp. CCTCC AB2023176]|uniref:hypothetical protein n=1 Tax=Roseomonas sp. CCTCC AB2023176 TaxID=3342640 RepID=UPI0035D59A20
MRSLALLCLVLAFGLAAFGYWGLATSAGRHAFDEMAGMVPVAALLASPLLGLVALGLAWGARRRR